MAFEDFSNFVLEKVLKDDPSKKVVTLLGSFDGKEGKAIVQLEKQPWGSPNLTESLKQIALSVETLNNQYGHYTGTGPLTESNLGVHIIYPAEDNDLRKYSGNQKVMVTETPEDYQTTVKPHILETAPAGVPWVTNILEGMSFRIYYKMVGKAEVDKVIGKDEDKEVGFLLVQDWKWPGEVMTDLYLLAIPFHYMRSIRDLNASHLPLLQNMRSKTYQWVKERFGLPPSKLRVYFHYLPTYYHLHVHVTHIDNHALTTDQNHILLDSVINNLTLMGEYYSRCTLYYSLKQTHLLVEKLTK